MAEPTLKWYFRAAAAGLSANRTCFTADAFSPQESTVKKSFVNDGSVPSSVPVSEPVCTVPGAWNLLT